MEPRDTIQGIYNIVRVTFPPCIIMNQYFKISQCFVSLQPFNMKTPEISDA